MLWRVARPSDIRGRNRPRPFHGQFSMESSIGYECWVRIRTRSVNRRMNRTGRLIIANRKIFPISLCLTLLAGAGRSAPVAAEPVTCDACHASQKKELKDSIHGGMECAACHAGNTSFTLSADELRKFTSQPEGVRPAFDHGQGFSGKPARSDVPMLCGTCHADVERMNPYGIRTDQLARYWTSGHGKALRANKDDRVAVCIDCHGNHDVASGRDPRAKTHPSNVPDTCGACHADAGLMAEYDLPVEVVDEYRDSVHGKLLLEMGDTGSPTCVTCHGNHSAMPPGFSSVSAVCGKCHQQAALEFAKSTHADQIEHKGCVQCHGGGEDRHFHLIERITNPAGIMLERYAHLLASKPSPTPEQITEAIHPGPKQIIRNALATCMDCHEDIEDDESLPKLFVLLDEIAEAERNYVRTGLRLDEVGRGVTLVDAQRFKFEDAKTHLIQLAPLQHTLSLSVVSDKVKELNDVCADVNADLDALEAGLRWRYRALIPIWVFSLLFSAACYMKYKQLKAVYCQPEPRGDRSNTEK